MTNELLSILALAMVLGVGLVVGAVSLIYDRPRDSEETEREEA